MCYKKDFGGKTGTLVAAVQKRFSVHSPDERKIEI